MRPHRAAGVGLALLTVLAGLACSSDDPLRQLFAHHDIPDHHDHQHQADHRHHDRVHHQRDHDRP